MKNQRNYGLASYPKNITRLFRTVLITAHLQRENATLTLTETAVTADPQLAVYVRVVEPRSTKTLIYSPVAAPKTDCGLAKRLGITMLRRTQF